MVLPLYSLLTDTEMTPSKRQKASKAKAKGPGPDAGEEGERDEFDPDSEDELYLAEKLAKKVITVHPEVTPFTISLLNKVLYEIGL